LLKNGAYPHAEDNNGRDCCDKASKIEEYAVITALTNRVCKYEPGLRKDPQTMINDNILQKENKAKVKREGLAGIKHKTNKVLNKGRSIIIGE